MKRVGILALEGIVATQLADISLRTYAEVLILIEEQAQLRAKVGKILVVWCRRQQQDTVVLAVNEVLDVFVARALRIAEVVALIDDNESVITHIVGIDAFGVRHNGSFEVITYDIFLPHVLQICRADDQCRAAEVILKNFGNSTCCDSLSQSYHIANHRALVLLVHQMLCRNLHGVFLEWEEHFLELWSKLIAVNASTCILAEPVGCLEVYIIRWEASYQKPNCCQWHLSGHR